MSGRTKPKKKGFLSKFPSFRKKKSSSASSISPDKDANANPQPIQTQTFPPPPDFATDNNDTFTEPSQNLNIDETRVDNPNFKVAPVALTTSTTSQSAKRPNAMDEYEIGSSAKRMNSKSEDADCTIIVNTSVHSPSKPASTNQALKSAFFGVTPSNVETKPNGDVCSQSTNKIADLPIGSQMQTATTSVKKVDRSAKTDDNENPWQHKSDTGNDGKNKNDVWLSKGNNPWAKLPSPTGTQNSEKKESSEAPLQNDTFVLDKSVLNTTNKNATAFKKDLCNTNNIYLLDREKHDNRIRLTYTGNTTSSTFTGNADAGLPTTCEAMKNTDLNDEEIELEKASTGNSAQQQANDKPKADSHRLISTGSQDALVENSPRVSNIQGRHDSRSQSDSSPRNVSRLNGTTSQPIQSTPTKQMPLSTVRHPQLSAVKGRFYSNSVDSAELDSIASDDLMCDSRFIDDEVMGFDEESFLSDLADGPKNSILQTRLSRNGRIRSQSLEASSKHDEKVIDSRRLRSITMGASPPSKVYDSTPNGKILEEPQHMTNFNERSKENHVGFSRLNRSLHLNLTSQLSFTSDEEVTMDANTFRHLMQDMTNMKTMLFKLKRVIQDNNNAITGSLPTSPVTTVNPMLGQDNILVDLTQVSKQENVQLKTEITSMKRLIEETDKTVGRLHGELLEFQTAQTELSNRNQVPKRDVGVQADLPIISYKVYKPSYIPRPTTFRTRSEVRFLKVTHQLNLNRSYHCHQPNWKVNNSNQKWKALSHPRKSSCQNNLYLQRTNYQNQLKFPQQKTLLSQTFYRLQVANQGRYSRQDSSIQQRSQHQNKSRNNNQGLARLNLLATAPIFRNHQVHQERRQNQNQNCHSRDYRKVTPLPNWAHIQCRITETRQNLTKTLTRLQKVDQATNRSLSRHRHRDQSLFHRQRLM
ncbi:uncharacterized protein [Antedon mediterranea]|uniref:uncharacterized protein isoform X5 n=1 Tax=Antedon mediterranea TaxID=105859 RepID=UPI003AF70259